MTHSLASHTNGYHLSGWQVALCAVTLTNIPHAIRHGELAVGAQKDHWFGHIVLAIIECIPGIGIIASAIEYVVASILKTKTSAQSIKENNTLSQEVVETPTPTQPSPVSEPLQPATITQNEKHIDSSQPVQQSSSTDVVPLLEKFKAPLLRIAEVSTEMGLVLSKSDRSHISEWIERVVVLQKSPTLRLLPPAFEKGDSQGFTYSIKKDERLCGYLYGTIHDNTDGVDQISVDTQKRLYECAILGAELNLSVNGMVESVEKHLASFALKNGIANIGIDDIEARLPTGRKLVLGTENLELLERTLLQNQKVLLRSYYTGDIDLMKITSNLQDAIMPPTNNQATSEATRNQTMAENIDMLLKACDIVAHEKEMATIKCFFAVGTDHVISRSSDSLVELLQKKGWTLEYIPPKPVHFPENVVA